MNKILHTFQKLAIPGVSLLVVVFISLAAVKNEHNSRIENIISKLQSFSSLQAREALYIHTNGTTFIPGDTIWLKAYNQMAGLLTPSPLGKFLIVGLYNRNGKKITANRFMLKDGTASGQMVLPDSIKPGNLFLIAGSNYTLSNFPDDKFKKEIKIRALDNHEARVKISMNDSIYDINNLIQGEIEVLGEREARLGLVKTKLQLKQGQNILDEKIIKTGQDGIGKFDMRIPEKLENESVLLNAQILQRGLAGSLSVHIPVASVPPVVRFFPESGQLVNGIATQVAFEATDSEGNPLNLRGDIIDAQKHKIIETAATAFGMGSFRITPDKDKKLFLKITEPIGYHKIYELPHAIKSGYSLNLLENGAGRILLKVESNSGMPNDSVSVVIYLRNEIYFTTTKPTKDLGRLSVPVNTMPMGVAKITVFDKYCVPRAERLVFINKDTQLKVKCKSLKHSYAKKEKVSVNLELLNNSGSPIPGNFSMSVSPKNYYSNSENIMTSLLLSDVLKGEIPAVDDYFSMEPYSSKLMELLMLTRGWRKFTWLNIFEGNKLSMKNTPVISGTVTTKKGKPVKNGDVVLMNINTFMTASTITGNQGQFSFSNSDYFTLADTSKLILTATGPGGKKNVIIKLNELIPQSQLAELANSSGKNNLFDLNFYASDADNEKPDEDATNFFAKTVYSDITRHNFWLEDVQVQAKRSVVIPAEVYEKEHKTYKLDKNRIHINIGNNPQSGIIQLLREVAGTFTVMDKGKILFRGYNSIYSSNQQRAVFVVNGQVAGYHCNDINYLDAGDIEEIKVTKSSAAGLKYSRYATGGLIEITTKKAKPENFKPTPSKTAKNIVKIPGYGYAKAYYSPVYTEKEEKSKHIDLRRTLFWNPNISVNKSGKSSIEYFNSDVPGKYELRIEGISKSGVPVHIVKEYTVF